MAVMTTAAGSGTRTTAPSPGGTTARVVPLREPGGISLELRGPRGLLEQAWEDRLPAGMALSGTPLWLDDQWLLLRTRAGALSSGAFYLSVQTREWIGATWVDAQRASPAEASLSLYADVTFWVRLDGEWRRQPNLLYRDRPLYPVTFPLGIRFAAWNVDSPSHARTIIRAVQHYRELRAAQAAPHDLNWGGRPDLFPSPKGNLGAISVTRRGETFASVLVLPLDEGDPERMSDAAALLPTGMHSEQEGFHITWMNESRLRLDAPSRYGEQPTSETLTLSSN